MGATHLGRQRDDLDGGTMSTPAADDFAEIARRIKEIEAESKGEAPKQEEQAQISPSEQESVFWGCFG